MWQERFEAGPGRTLLEDLYSFKPPWLGLHSGLVGVYCAFRAGKIAWDS
jgi:hypothetical protein